MTATITPNLDLKSSLLDLLNESCPQDLQPNPHTTIKLLTGKQDIHFQLEAPIPGKGLARTITDLESGRAIHSFLLRVMMDSATRGDRATPALVQELAAAGALLPRGMTPVRPLFRCMLTDDELGRLWAANLMDVRWQTQNEPTLLPACAQLHGHNPTWIYDPVRQLDWPYWLTAAQTEQLGRIAPAGVSVHAEHWHSVRVEATSTIRSRGYGIVRDLLPPELLRSVQEYYRELVANGFLPLGDDQSLRYSLHNEPLAHWLHVHTAPLVSRIIPESIKPSYNYLGFYLAGAVLEKHTDREQCEYTLSLTVDATPSAAARDAWPLYADLKGGTTVEVLLGAGDGLIFKGRELPHYRHRLDEGRRSSSVFFHYVPVAFTKKLN
jgi:hypothetical protein